MFRILKIKWEEKVIFMPFLCFPYCIENKLNRDPQNKPFILSDINTFHSPHLPTYIFLVKSDLTKELAFVLTVYIKVVSSLWIFTFGGLDRPLWQQQH